MRRPSLHVLALLASRGSRFPASHCSLIRWALGPKRFAGNSAVSGHRPTTHGARALRLWNDQLDDWLPASGRRPSPVKRPPACRCTEWNDYLNATHRRLESGRITPRTFDEYHATGARLTHAFGRNRQVAGLSPKDLGKLYDTLAKPRGLVALGPVRRDVSRPIGFGGNP
jgi:hypothetical protein